VGWAPRARDRPRGNAYPVDTQIPTPYGTLVRQLPVNDALAGGDAGYAEALRAALEWP
jgi:hypothetical protein